MEVKNILHMNTGDGEFSYAKNSSLQETVIRKTVPILKEAIKGIANLGVFSDQCFNVADLGCSSGPNSLFVLSKILDIISEVCEQRDHKAPQLQVFLNDLFGNDFNTIFKLLPTFYAELKKDQGENFGPCFVMAVPGSFYGRLFPDQSLHFVHSCYGAHWLSQVPEGIDNNHSNIYMAKTSPPNVFEAYMKQFHNDFTNFLRLRSKELICGGRMVLSILGRSIDDPTTDDCCRLWELLAESLLDMVTEGLVQATDINSFNIPFYTPCRDEVKDVIQNEGSFSLETLNFFQVNWDPCDTDYTEMCDLNAPTHGKNASKIVRAVIEPMLVSHFGNSITDVLFMKYENNVAKHLATRKTRYFTMVISLTKK